MIKYILINHRRLYALSSDSMFTAVYNGDEWEGTNVSSYLNLNDKEDSRITEISEEEALAHTRGVSPSECFKQMAKELKQNSNNKNKR